MNAIQRAYAAGDYLEGQRLNVAEGVARGGTPESGGAIKPATTTTGTAGRALCPGTSAVPVAAALVTESGLHNRTSG